MKRRSFSAWIRFSATGDRLSDFRAALRTAHYPCREQRITGGVFRAAVRPRHWCGITRLAAEYGIELKTGQRSGIRYVLHPYRLRFGILAGLAVGGYLLYQSNAYVRTIRITGNSRVSDAEILTALDGLGVRCGTAFRDIAFTYVEQRMRLAVHDIEWIALRHTGGTLSVDLTEEREAPALHSRHIPTNYVAAVQAQITDMEVLDGTPVKARGDAVKPGDLLISGVEETERGLTRYHHAEGRVTGIYEAEFTRMQPFHAELPVHGTPVTAQYLEILGKRIPLQLGFTAPLEDCVYEEYREPVMLFGMQLPVMRLRCVYTPRRTAETAYTAEEARTLLTEAAALYVQNFHAQDRKISEQANFSETEEGILLRMHYVFEGEIGQISEIFINEK